MKKEAPVMPVRSQERICEIRKCVNEEHVNDPRMRQVCKEFSRDF